MALSSDRVRALVEHELSRVQDDAARGRIRELVVAPYPVEREWFYGTPGQRYTCWTVLQDPELNIAIAYCDEGFGPGHPWGSSPWPEREWVSVPIMSGIPLWKRPLRTPRYGTIRVSRSDAEPLYGAGCITSCCNCQARCSG
jgi:hypothetical protein